MMERCHALDTFMKHVLAHPELRNSPAISIFLRGDDEQLAIAQELPIIDFTDAENVIALQGLISDKPTPVVPLSDSSLFVPMGSPHVSNNNIPVTMFCSIAAPLCS